MEKSENDPRRYRFIKLDNQLEVLLISDTSTHHSAACLTVNVGSYSESVLGLAHLIEHLLFLGSEKYPGESIYDEAVKGAYGSHNAFTCGTYTTYYFGCVSSKFSEVLDIFSHVFVSPSFTPKYVEKEIAAIHEEYLNNKSDDGIRFDRGITQFYNATFPDTILRCGNNQTLNHEYIRDEVINFFNKYYSADIMKLVVVHYYSLAEMECLVRKSFSDIPNHRIKDNRPKNNSSCGKLFNNDVQGHIISKKEIHQYRIIWEFPTINSNVNNYVYNFLCYLLNSSSKGFLFEFLYRDLIISNINSYFDESKDYTRLSINIKFTKSGWSYKKYIVNLIKKYLTLIRDSKNEVKELYESYRQKLLLEYKYYVPENALSTVQKISEDWTKLKINPNQLISYDKVLPKYNFVYLSIRLLLEATLEATEAVFTFSKDELLNESLLIEDSYGVQYQYTKDKYHTPKKIIETLPVKKFDIGNILYFCNNFKDQNEWPKRLFKDYEVYWNHSIKYESPRIYLIASICNLKNWSITESIIIDILLMSIQDSLKVIKGDAEQFSYNIVFEYSSSEMKLEIDGYSNYFVEIFSKVADTILSYKNKLNKKIVLHYIEDYRIKLQNNVVYKMDKKSKEILENNLIKGYYHTDDLLEEIERISVDEILNFNLLISTKLYALINGNVNHSLAKQIGNILLPLVEIPKYMLREQLKKVDEETNEEINQHIFRVINKKEDHDASCCRLSVRFGYMKRTHDGSGSRVLSQLQTISKLLYTEYFHILRTKEQLCYSINCKIEHYGIDIDNLYTTCDFIIVSHVVDAQYLYQRTLKFIDEFDQFLERCKESYINDLIDAAHEDSIPIDSLEEQTHDDYSSIVRGYTKNAGKYVITKRDLINFYRYWFKLNNTNHWVLLID